MEVVSQLQQEAVKAQFLAIDDELGVSADAHAESTWCSEATKINRSDTKKLEQRMKSTTHKKIARTFLHDGKIWRLA